MLLPNVAAEACTVCKHHATGESLHDKENPLGNLASTPEQAMLSLRPSISSSKYRTVV